MRKYTRHDKNIITDVDEVEKMVIIAEKLCNLPPQSLCRRVRTHDILMPRMVVSNIARYEREIHYSTIAEVLNHDRCSIYHYEKTHEQNYKYWTDYRNLFNNIVTSISDYKKSNTIDNTIKENKDLKNYILDNTTIKENKAGKVFISVKLNDLHTDIQTNYRDFSSTLKKIQYCMSDYNAKIDVSL